MKKVFVVGGLLLLVLAACSKKNDPPPYDRQAQYTIDSTKIVAYAVANNITNMQHDSAGIFYQIINRGDTRDTANTAALVNIGYVGTYLDKTVFDSSYNASFGLNGTIDGVKYGVPKIGRGGEINLFLPSVYGYGQYGTSRIPGNTVLIFNIKLKSFTNR